MRSSVQHFLSDRRLERNHKHLFSPSVYSGARKYETEQGQDFGEEAIGFSNKSRGWTAYLGLGANQITLLRNSEMKTFGFSISQQPRGLDHNFVIQVILFLNFNGARKWSKPEILNRNAIDLADRETEKRTRKENIKNISQLPIPISDYTRTESFVSLRKGIGFTQVIVFPSKFYHLSTHFQRDRLSLVKSFEDEKTHHEVWGIDDWIASVYANGETITKSRSRPAFPIWPPEIFPDQEFLKSLPHFYFS